MSLIQWKPAFSVNIKQIDTQHMKLVELINSLHESMKAGKGKEKLSQIFNELTLYTVNHFKTEEDLFNKYGYPATKAHIIEHQKLVEQVVKIKKEFESGQPVLSSDVMNFLKEWLSKHITGSDKSYTAFLNSKGVV